MLNPWLALSFKAFQLGIEAQSVVALRMMRLASGGVGTRADHVYLRSPEKRVKRRRAQIQAARQSAEEIESAKRVCAWCSMPFSNTPFDLKTVIVRALDSACTNAATRIKRLFKSILLRYQGASATFVPDGTGRATA